MTEPVGHHYATLMGIARGYQRSQALAVAAALGIADLVADRSRSVADLAEATGTDSAALYRLLRALASIGVFHEDADRRFGLTAMGELLRRDHPQSIDPTVRMFCADYQWRAWRELGYSVRTGGNAVVHTLGMDVWEHRRHNPADGAVFDAAMRTMAASYAAGIVEAYDFGRHRVVADIGGGTGMLLAAILRAHPTVSGSSPSSRRSCATPLRCSPRPGSPTGRRSWSAISSSKFRPAPMLTCCCGCCTTGVTRTRCGSCDGSARRWSPPPDCWSSTVSSARRTRTR
jgi:hypothetical protein